MPHPILRIAIYARISKDDKGYAIGVTDQVKQCRDLAAERFPDAVITGPACQCRKCREIDVPPDVYCDNDLSASGKVARPHYDRLVADIRAGLVDAVLVVDTDRLHRNLLDLEGYMNVCEPRDVPTHTVKSGRIDLSTPAGRAFARVGGTFARYEWEQMVARQKSAKRRNRDAGLRTSGIAGFGYRLDLDKRGERNRQIPGVSTGLVVEPREAEAVAVAYQKLLAGVSLSEIARNWNAAGFTTPAPYNGPWTVQSVRRVLLRPANAALIMRPAPDDGEILGPATWEPIVDEATWKAARAILGDSSRRVSPGAKPHHLLTGVLICGVCDGTYFCMRYAAGRRHNKVYSCMSYLRRGDPAGGRHLTRNMEQLDAYAAKVIVDRLREPDAAAAFARPFVDIEALLADRNGVRARLDEADALYASGAIDGRQLGGISSKLRPLLDEAEKKLTDAYTTPTGLDEFTTGRDPGDVWEGLPIERKRAVAATLLRIRLLPMGKGGGKRPAGWRAGMKRPFDPDFAEVIWQEA